VNDAARALVAAAVLEAECVLGLHRVGACPLCADEVDQIDEADRAGAEHARRGTIVSPYLRSPSVPVTTARRG
jgi:hypothetical protein